MRGLTRRFLGRLGFCAIGLIALALCTASTASAQTAQAFVEAIYKPYANKGFKGIPYSTVPSVRGYFEPTLAAAIIKDMEAADRRKEVPKLNGDPFIDAQDWEIANLAIDVKSAGERAKATVNFTNFGQPKTVTLDLVKSSSAGWRIADISAPSGSLRKLFKVK